jgi:two-component system sensor histidine kinase and response regulator WspE
VLVTLAHAMEECFLAAKEARESLTSARVDQLLKSVDVLSEVRALAEPDLPAWMQSRSGHIAELVKQLKSPPPSSPAPAASTPQSPTPAAQATPGPGPGPGPTPAPAESPAGPGSAAATVAGTVRVSAQVLNRMLFLAGESTVEASRFQSVRTLMAKLRGRERALEAALETLREALVADKRRAAAIDLPFAALASAADAVQGTLVEQSVGVEEAFRRVEELSGALYTEVLRSRMRPFSEGISAFPRMVRDIARQLGKSVEFRVEGEGVEVDREILQKLESPLTHMIRNSLDHGIEAPSDRLAAGKPEQGTISLTARHQSGMLVIEIRDDGRGIDPEAIRRRVVERGLVDPTTVHRLTRAELMEFPFLPGFTTKQTTTEISGRGVGLDIVRTMVQDVSGTVTLDSEPGRGTRFTLRLPVTRSVIRAALVRVGEQMFAVPLARLDRIAIVPREEIQTVQGRLQFVFENQSIGLVYASDMFGGEPPSDRSADLPVLVFGGTGEACGLIVTQVCGEEDLLVRPLDARLGAVAHIAAAAIRADGRPVFVVDVDDLSRSVKRAVHEGRPLGFEPQAGAGAQQTRRRILVVDDSITVREVERQLLLRRGYAVEVAVDGKEGYNALRAGQYDLLITDVDMPRMTGIELIRAIRKEPRFAELPVIIVSYKDREEDRRMGMEAGANAYLTKSSFHDESLIRTVEDLIGAPV